MASYSLFSNNGWSNPFTEPHKMNTSPYHKTNTHLFQSPKYRNWKGNSSSPTRKMATSPHLRRNSNVFQSPKWRNWRGHSSPPYKSPGPGMSPFQRSVYKMTNKAQENRKGDFQHHSNWILKLLESPDMSRPSYNTFHQKSPTQRVPFSRTPGKRIEPNSLLRNDPSPSDYSRLSNLSNKEFHELLQNSKLHPYSQVFEPAYTQDKAMISGLNDSFQKLQKPTREHSFHKDKFTNETNGIVPLLMHWNGTLPPKDVYNTKYSKKVFLGGVPWDITDMDIQKTFNMFGSLSVEWPPARNSDKPPKGYVYIVFDDENSVSVLLEHCRNCSIIPYKDVLSDGSPYKYYIQSNRMPSKEIQIIPWNMNDSTKVIGQKDKVNLKYQVFVGGLHGMLTATGLALVMNDLFKNVVYVEIDTDRYKYPLGSGHVVFCSEESYLKAIHCKYVKISCKSPKIEKRIQIDPFIKDNVSCHKCDMPGPLYCRSCFAYFCNECWHSWHVSIDQMHEYVSRDRNGV